jgi:hypothetical protein
MITLINNRLAFSIKRVLQILPLIVLCINGLQGARAQTPALTQLITTDCGSLNVWVVEEITEAGISSGIKGFAPDSSILANNLNLLNLYL